MNGGTAAQLRRIGDLSGADFKRRLRDAGLGVRIGPFDLKIRARAGALDGALQALYSEYALLEGKREYSFHVQLQDQWQWLPRPRRQVRFLVDGRAPHEDHPAAQALAVLEWGINLVVALRYQCFLMLHAAVVERHGLALILPAEPGSGKTTLCAALVHRGWRLLSDEFGILRPGNTQLIPFPRLLPLKNDSIGIIQRFAPEARWGPLVANTRKGNIRHMMPPRESIDRASETARARWLVFPRWQRDAALSLTPLPRAQAFMQLAANAFNYEMLGESAFETVRALIDSCSCHTLDYSRLDDAIAALGDMAERHAR